MEKQKTNQIVVIGVVVMVAVSLIFTVGNLVNGGKEPEVTVADGQVEIYGLFGVTFPVSEIVSVTLLDKSMDEIGIGQRTNGYAGFDTLRLGHFHADALGDYLLYARTDASPTIRIDRAGDAEDVYLSYADSAKTETVFYELSAVAPQG